MEGIEGNGKVREMQLGRCGCCPDLGAGLGDLVPAPHKKLWQIRIYGRNGSKVFVWREILFIYWNMTCNTF
jgi:hypothetical protein